ncbi:SymE family type I addiction module toxin [Erwinia sp. P7711]|uniref:SymE family type I addiction module toxin n=1 Tax=Erwinia sp. P7711 TaxID=3141451 RepID=UPI0031935C8C
MSISKALRRLKVEYTSIRYADRKDMTMCYSRCPSLNLKGNWLAEAGFGNDTPVTVAVEVARRTNWLKSKMPAAGGLALEVQD